MPIAYILTLAFQLVLAIHVARTGRSLYWIMIIVMLPLVGGVAYLLVEVLPGLRQDPTARRALGALGRAIDPAANRRRIEDRLALADTQENRRQLAEECLRLGDFGNAAALYQRCLSGVYLHDPDLLLGRAHAEFGQGDYAACRRSLEELIQHNPQFRSHDGHLLYARALAELGDKAAALAEYAVLADGYPGEEARLRYAELLIQCEQPATARPILDTILTRSRSAPRYYRRKEAEWLTRARKLRTAVGDR
ncbi:MAG: tetratricopeptide repeat protein [Lysobacterales bacterium]